MLDIETMGNTSNSVIVSIGAVRFDMETGETGGTFYRIVDIDSCLDAGLKVNGSTIKWWLTKSEEARKEIVKEGIHIAQALQEFNLFIRNSIYSEIWSNGVRFDIALMEDAYIALKLPVPWDFHAERDVRTLVSFAPKIQKKHADARKDILHHPIDDCKTQIAYCSEIYNLLNLK